MQFTTLFIASLASAVLAAPTTKRQDPVGQWTFQGTSLACPEGDQGICNWHLSVLEGDGEVKTCDFSVTGAYSDIGETNCNTSDLVVSMGWSGAGFWTLAVKDYGKSLISYVGYNTGELPVTVEGATAADKTENVFAL
jgi:hypothetical protein